MGTRALTAALDHIALVVGNQAGGRVFLFLKTDDFDRDYSACRARGVRFAREPKHAPCGKVAVSEDLYGNLWAWCSSRLTTPVPNLLRLLPSGSSSPTD